MDALAYIIELMELGNRYFEPAAYLDKEGNEDPEAEFRELENEYEPLMDNWRVA